LTGATAVTRIGRLRPPILCLVTDRQRLGESSLETVVEEAVKGGVNVVQLRERDLPAGELLAMATRLREVTRGRALLIINDRLDVAVAAGADGVHLPESGLPEAFARRLLGRHAIIGRAVHSKEAAVEAEQAGADYVQLGTIYATQSKPDLKPSGPKLVREVSAAVAVPVLAVGGVNPENAAEVIDAGAFGASVISAILGAEDPQAAARQLVEAMAEAWKKRSEPPEQKPTQEAKAS
jgi:thiamine-phosphate pyrophosphorylase